MIEVFGKDGRAFRFQDGTPDDIIQTALDKHYGAEPELGRADILETAADGTQSQMVKPSAAPQIIQEATSAASSVPPIQQTIQHLAQSVQPTAPSGSNNDQVFQPKSQDSAMRITMMMGAAAVGVLALMVVLWSTGVVGKGPKSQTASSAGGAASAYQATPQPDMRAAQVATQIRQDSKSDSAVLKELAAGATVDVLGEQTIANVNWLRVRVDQTTGAIGYVVASHLGAIGATAPGVNLLPSTGNSLAVPPTGRLQSSGSVQTPPAAMPVTTYYVVSRELNVRMAATPDAAKVGRLEFGTPVLADAQSTYQGRIWLRVRANNGVSGWINSDLVSLTPGAGPIDQPQYAAPPPGRSSYNAVAAAATNAVVEVTSPSFRCGNNLTEIEQAICSDPELSLLDREYANLYRKAIKKFTGAERTRITREQRLVIKDRNRCTDTYCIANWYQTQISVFSGVE